jgi:hypothetical protein
MPESVPPSHDADGDVQADQSASHGNDHASGDIEGGIPNSNPVVRYQFAEEKVNDLVRPTPARDIEVASGDEEGSDDEEHPDIQQDSDDEIEEGMFDFLVDDRYDALADLILLYAPDIGILDSQLAQSLHTIQGLIWQFKLRRMPAALDLQLEATEQMYNECKPILVSCLGNNSTSLESTLIRKCGAMHYSLRRLDALPKPVTEHDKALKQEIDRVVPPSMLACERAIKTIQEIGQQSEIVDEMLRQARKGYHHALNRARERTILAKIDNPIATCVLCTRKYNVHENTPFLCHSHPLTSPGDSLQLRGMHSVASVGAIAQSVDLAPTTPWSEISVACEERLTFFDDDLARYPDLQRMTTTWCQHRLSGPDLTAMTDTWAVLPGLSLATMHALQQTCFAVAFMRHLIHSHPSTPLGMLPGAVQIRRDPELQHLSQHEAIRLFVTEFVGEYRNSDKFGPYAARVRQLDINTLNWEAPITPCCVDAPAAFALENRPLIHVIRRRQEFLDTVIDSNREPRKGRYADVYACCRSVSMNSGCRVSRHYSACEWEHLIVAEPRLSDASGEADSLLLDFESADLTRAQVRELQTQYWMDDDLRCRHALNLHWLRNQSIDVFRCAPASL